MSISCRSNDNGFADEQDSIVVSQEQATFVSKIGHLRFQAAHTMECEGGEFNVAVSRVAHRIFALCLFPIRLAVAQQCV